MILWLRERFKWMGAHSGYDALFETIPAIQPGDYASAWREPGKTKPRLQKRLLDYIAKDTQASPFYNYDSTAAELSALWQCFKSRHDLVHVAYVESSLGILSQFKQSRNFKLLGTVHQPKSWWRLFHSYPKSICALDGLIVLSHSEMPYFEQFLPDRVYCIPHGVDTDFFHPRVTTTPTSERPRCVFSGSWLRDLESLMQVIDRVLAQDPTVQFDMVVPRSNRNHPTFHRVARHDQVFWHAGISDEQLREIYQRASCILLHFLDSTANNALLEAMACGLPIVSTRVGGTSDYAQPSFAYLHAIGDVDGMAESVLKLVNDPPTRQNMGIQARAFTEQNFRWDLVARKTLEIYNQLLADS